MDNRTLQILAEIYVVWNVFGQLVYMILAWLIGGDNGAQ